MKRPSQEELDAILEPIVFNEDVVIVNKDTQRAVLLTTKQFDAIILAVRGAIGLRSLEKDREYLRKIVALLRQDPKKRPRKSR